jgi:VanZ family protein
VRTAARWPIVWYWGPAIAAMAGIFFASSLPTVPKIVRDTSDLLLHFLAYGGLALLVIRAIASGRWDRLTPASWWLAWLITAGYGVTDEFHQSFVPGRFTSVADWIADASGAAVALGAVMMTRRIRSRAGRNREV